MKKARRVRDVLSDWAVVLYSILGALTSFAIFVAVLGAGLVGLAAGVATVVDWVQAPAPCEGTGRPVVGLLQSVESGRLLARRAAIAGLRCAAPADAAELERLAGFARGRPRRALRASALAALSRTRSVALKARVLSLAADPDADLGRAALAAGRGMGVLDSDPALAEAFKAHPDWRLPPPAAARPAWRSGPRLRAEAALVESWFSRADLAAFSDRRDRAVSAARDGDRARLEELLQDPSFVVGGRRAGAALAGAGEAFRPRARELSLGADPVLRAVGVGALEGLGDTKGLAAAARRAREGR